ncbi:hypothetical protein [Daejeonella sp.]|uniref:hypothetical protein n=1 Tax=Daejeonella sp. TaxID=2805397 RepID=UPI0030BFDA97
MYKLTPIVFLTLLACFTISCNKESLIEGIKTAPDQSNSGTGNNSISKVPTLITSSPTEVAITFATISANVTNVAGSAIIEKGIVWSTTPKPTIDLNSRTNENSTSNNFTSSIKDLKSNTKYYVRSYAKNNAGIGYGNEITFTTGIGPTLYIVGTGGTIMYENGFKRKFGIRGSGKSVAASGSDIYVIEDGNDAKLYKNDMIYPLAIGSMKSSPSSIFLSGTSIYAVGASVNSNNDVSATLWINGERNLLLNTTWSYFSSIFIDETTNLGVIVGNTKGSIPDNTVPIFHVLGSNSILGTKTLEVENYYYKYSANAGFVLKNDIYIAGSQTDRSKTANYKPIFWKNGVRQPLLNEGKDIGSASSVFVLGTDVYVAGTVTKGLKSVACLWKNGIPQYLSDGAYFGMAYAITGYGTDIYVVGTDGLNAVIWKNGVKEILWEGGSAKAVFKRNN